MSRVECSYLLLLGSAPSVVVRASIRAATHEIAAMRWHPVSRRALYSAAAAVSAFEEVVPDEAALLGLHQSGADCGDSACGISMFSQRAWHPLALLRCIS